MGIKLFRDREPEVIENELKGADLILEYTGNSTGLELINTTPVPDAVAMVETDSTKYFDFSVETDLKKAHSVEYEIYITKDKNTSNLSDDDIRVYLEKENSGTYTKVFGPEKYTPLKKESKFGNPTFIPLSQALCRSVLPQR